MNKLGFSLLEMIIAIGLVSLIMTLTISTGLRGAERAERRAVQDAITDVIKTVRLTAIIQQAQETADSSRISALLGDVLKPDMSIKMTDDLIISPLGWCNSVEISVVKSGRTEIASALVQGHDCEISSNAKMVRM